jgi:Fic/DOC family
MTASNPRFVLGDQAEVFASDAATSSAVHRAVKAGRVRRIARGLFTRNTSEPLESVVSRNWGTIAAIYASGSVVVDRSAFEARPAVDGSLILDGGPELKETRTHRLPGLRLRVRPGPGPVTGDMPHLTGLYFSSRARAWLDNMATSRARTGVPRTLSRADLERELNRTVAVRGWDAVNELRDQARDLAPELGAEKQFAALDDLIGALQGTRDASLTTSAGKSAARGRAFDPARIKLFGRLHAALLVEQLPRRPEQTDSLPALSFIEAYFSNWIEGTEFELREAEAIVFERAIPQDRVEDAHDVLGTFDLVNDESRRAELPSTAEEFVDLLRSDHAAMLERRPEARPGQFKQRENRAGHSTFVHPDLVLGTLQEGFRFVDSLPPGLPRAIYLQFLITEVHPFTDGNGRVARVFMNAALTTEGLQRVVIPLAFRDNYLGSLRALSRNGDPAPLINVIDFAQRYATAIPWQTLERAEDVLRATNAFVPPDEAEQTGVRLRLPELGGEQLAAVKLDRGLPTEETTRRWAADHLDELTLIWERFKPTGEWPDSKQLARELFGAGREFDVALLSRSMPPRLGRFDRASGRVMLKPRGLSFVADAQPLLSNIPKLVRIAVERYGDPTVEPIISSSEFPELLGLSDLEARELSELLLLDGWLLQAFGNDDQGNQQFQIDSSAILRVRNAQSLRDYFTAEDDRS